jgi:hypothetical protein
MTASTRLAGTWTAAKVFEAHESRFLPEAVADSPGRLLRSVW